MLRYPVCKAANTVFIKTDKFDKDGINGRKGALNQREMQKVKEVMHLRLNFTCADMEGKLVEDDVAFPGTDGVDKPLTEVLVWTMGRLLRLSTLVTIPVLKLRLNSSSFGRFFLDWSKHGVM